VVNHLCARSRILFCHAHRAATVHSHLFEGWFDMSDLDAVLDHKEPPAHPACTKRVLDKGDTSHDWGFGFALRQRHEGILPIEPGTALRCPLLVPSCGTPNPNTKNASRKAAFRTSDSIFKARNTTLPAPTRERELTGSNAACLLSI
jgi:hypothetical protein